MLSILLYNSTKTYTKQQFHDTDNNPKSSSKNKYKIPQNSTVTCIAMH